MKKKLTKILVLNKKTISNLTSDEMSLILGATLNLACTDSCSLNIVCCPTTQENVLGQILDQQGD